MILFDRAISERFDSLPPSCNPVRDFPLRNDLPQELRLLHIFCIDTFLGYVKTYLFIRSGVWSASE